MFVCPTIKRIIGGRGFTLRLDFNAITKAEELTGKNFLDGRFWNELDVRCVTALFYACVFADALEKHDNNEARAVKHLAETNSTLTDVRGFGPPQLAEMVEACKDAWQAVNDVPEEDTDRPTVASGRKQTKRAGSAHQRN
jgi:hypothetical protein